MVTHWCSSAHKHVNSHQKEVLMNVPAAPLLHVACEDAAERHWTLQS